MTSHLQITDYTLNRKNVLFNVFISAIYERSLSFSYTWATLDGFHTHAKISVLSVFPPCYSPNIWLCDLLEFCGCLLVLVALLYPSLKLRLKLLFTSIVLLSIVFA